MLLNVNKAVAVFRKIRQVREHYQKYVLNGQSTRVSVTDLRYVIEDMYGVKIEMTQVAFDSVFVRGMIERYPERAIIRVWQELPEDWKRFTAVKELCHVIIDEPEDWSADGVSTITDLLFEYELENGSEAQQATQSEAFAEIAALELLYPYEFRAYDMDQVEKGKTTNIRIAIHHGMPVHMVSRALSNPYNDEIAEHIWRLLESNDSNPAPLVPQTSA